MIKPSALVAGSLALLLALAAAPAQALAGGKVSWLDEIVQDVIRQARGADTAATASARGTTKLFAKQADEPLEAVAKQYDSLAGVARRADEPTDALLNSRFQRLVKGQPDSARVFSELAPAERRLVVEMGETAKSLTARYGDQTEEIVRKLGTEGLSAVRVYGDDVAEVIAKEGAESVNVLRKTGRNGWAFFTGTVLPNKGKLAAAGVLGLFLANPEKFVDTAGHVTEYAVREFAKAGIALTGAIAGGAARGIGEATAQALGWDNGFVRAAGMAAAGLVVLLALMVLVGFPIRALFRPFGWIFRGRPKVAAAKPPASPGR